MLILETSFIIPTETILKFGALGALIILIIVSRWVKLPESRQSKPKTQIAFDEIREQIQNLSQKLKDDPKPPFSELNDIEKEADYIQGRLILMSNPDHCRLSESEHEIHGEVTGEFEKLLNDISSRRATLDGRPDIRGSV